MKVHAYKSSVIKEGKMTTLSFCEKEDVICTIFKGRITCDRCRFLLRVREINKEGKS